MLYRRRAGRSTCEKFLGLGDGAAEISGGTIRAEVAAGELWRTFVCHFYMVWSARWINMSDHTTTYTTGGDSG